MRKKITVATITLIAVAISSFAAAPHSDAAPRPMFGGVGIHR